MPIPRSTLTTGPAIVITTGASIYFKTGLTIQETLETFDVTTSMHGTVDKRIRNRSVTISGQPAGESVG